MMVSSSSCQPLCQCISAKLRQRHKSIYNALAGDRLTVHIIPDCYSTASQVGSEPPSKFGKVPPLEKKIIAGKMTLMVVLASK